MAAVAAHGRPGLLARAAAVTAVVSGKITGRIISVLPTLPGIGGAVLVSLGTGETVSHVLGRGLAPWVGLTVGGVFALMLDRNIPARRRP